MAKHQIKLVKPPSLLCSCGKKYEMEPKDTRPWEKALMDWMDVHKAHESEFAEAELTDEIKGATGE
jgi:hypothetical protein